MRRLRARVPGVDRARRPHRRPAPPPRDGRVALPGRGRHDAARRRALAPTRGASRRPSAPTGPRASTCGCCSPATSRPRCCSGSAARPSYDERAREGAALDREADAGGRRRLRHPRPARVLHRRSGAPDGQRVHVPVVRRSRTSRRSNEQKVTKIVTTCPHCFNTLGNEYPDFGGRYEVMHHTELLAELVRDGRLKPPADERTITYHDSCYLARHNDVAAEPRELVAAVGQPVEMEKHGKRTFCCGAGGAHMWMEERGSEINEERVRAGDRDGRLDARGGVPVLHGDARRRRALGRRRDRGRRRRDAARAGRRARRRRSPPDAAPGASRHTTGDNGPGMHVPIELAVLVAVLVVGAIAAAFVDRLGAPTLLLFLGLGMLLGEDGPGGIEFDDATLVRDAGSVALALILLEGGVLAERAGDAEGAGPVGAARDARRRRSRPASSPARPTGARRVTGAPRSWSAPSSRRPTPPRCSPPCAASACASASSRCSSSRAGINDPFAAILVIGLVEWQTHDNYGVADGALLLVQRDRARRDRRRARRRRRGLAAAPPAAALGRHRARAGGRRRARRLRGRDALGGSGLLAAYLDRPRRRRRADAPRRRRARLPAGQARGSRRSGCSCCSGCS